MTFFPFYKYFYFKEKIIIGDISKFFGLFRVIRENFIPLRFVVIFGSRY